MLFTLRATAVSELLETVAVKVSVSPRNAVRLLGVMLMVMLEGGGSGGVRSEGLHTEIQTVISIRPANRMS
jgi:hypothetical protein